MCDIYLQLAADFIRASRVPRRPHEKPSKGCRQGEGGEGRGQGFIAAVEDALQQRQLRALRQIKVRQLNLTLDIRERDEGTSATESCQRCATLSPFWDTQDNFDR